MTSITLLDGSIGQELVRRSGERPTPLWSTQVMLDHPDLVEALHRDYFNAGASIATTNTYALLRDRLTPSGLEGQLASLTHAAVTAARKAQTAHGSGRVAGSIGPLIASYRPDICPPAAEAAERYAETVNLLKDHVDLLLIEAMSSVDQADGALRATMGQGLPVWLSVTVNDDDGNRLRSGEALTDLAPLIAQHQPDAVLVNCSRPEAIPQALAVLKTFDRPFGAYANGFTRITAEFLKDRPTVAALEERHDLTPDVYAAFAMRWVDQGATIVGGCCEVGPDHIATLCKSLLNAGHTLV